MRGAARFLHQRISNASSLDYYYNAFFVYRSLEVRHPPFCKDVEESGKASLIVLAGLPTQMAKPIRQAAWRSSWRSCAGRKTTADRSFSVEARTIGQFVLSRITQSRDRLRRLGCSRRDHDLRASNDGHLIAGQSNCGTLDFNNLALIASRRSW